MKKIVLKVTVEVPDDYVLNDPSWLLENIGMMYLICLKNTNPINYMLVFPKYCWQLADN